MSQPDPGSVHVNRPLTNMSLAFIQEQDAYAATQVFQTIGSKNQSDLYWEYPRGYWFTDEAQKRGPNAESAGSGFKVQTRSFACDVWAFHSDIPDQVRANEDSPLNSDTDAMEFVTQKMLIRKEMQFKTDYLGDGSAPWTDKAQGVAAGPTGIQVIQWSNYSTSDPISNVKSLITRRQKATGVRMRYMAIGQEVWDILTEHPDIIDRVKYAAGPDNPAIVTPKAVAALMGLREIIIASAVVNSGVEGGTDAFDFIWGKRALIFHRPPRPGVRVPAAGYTFGWTGYAGTNAEGQRIKKFRMESLASDRVEAEGAYDLHVVSADLATLLYDVIA
jgi:hypothetical protein